MTDEMYTAWIERRGTAPLNLRAYYYSFNTTGVRAIDEILAAVAAAGKGYHHTDGWNNEHECFDGHSYVDLIQEAANRAANILNGQTTNPFASSIST